MSSRIIDDRIFGFFQVAKFLLHLFDLRRARNGHYDLLPLDLAQHVEREESNDRIAWYIVG